MLVELAARDEPPTVIGDGLRGRLAAAGVDMLEPLLGPIEGGVEVADRIEELERVRVLYVAGPGLSSQVPLGEGATPVAEALERVLYGVERFDKLRRFRLAAKDMRCVEETARDLLDRDGPARVYERMLETALVVVYARPYLESSTSGVGRKWWPAPGPDRDLHERMIETRRHPYHAHSDRTRHRTLIDTTALLGLEGPPTFAEAWWRMTDSELEALADLARRQAQRLEAEGNRIGAELGEEHEESRTPTEEFERLRRELAEREATESADDPPNAQAGSRPL